MRVRFECNGSTLRTVDDWEGEAPSIGDDVSIVTPASRGKQTATMTFRVKARRFVRQESGDGSIAHMILLEVS